MKIMYYDFCVQNIIQNLKNSDQSWAGLAVVYKYWDMTMNQWSTVFYLHVDCRDNYSEYLPAYILLKLPICLHE